MLTFAGLAGLAVTIVALARGHVHWARIATRPVAALGLVASLVAWGIGGSLASSSGTTPSSSVSPAPAARSAVSTAGSVAPTPSTSLDTLAQAAASADASSALVALVGLTVRAGADPSGYVRAAFGQAWADVDRNGCDTRNDVLRRDLISAGIKPGTNGCTVSSGTLKDAYTGQTVSYARGGSTVEVDHVVALADAWASGANGWDVSARTAFANDPLELVTTSTALNQAKGDKNAALWLPPSVAFRCQYVSLQVAVKAKYTLTITAPERAAIGEVLTGCMTQALPQASPIPPLTATATTAPPAPQPSTQAGPGPGPGTTKTTPASAYYANCAAASAAGVAPIQRGQPGYRSGLDRDGDGIACE